jgi:Putative adhesin
MNQAKLNVTELEHRIGPRGRFTLRQASGEISIRGVEGDTVRVRSTDDTALGEQFEVETGDGFVELRQLEKFGLGIKMFGRGAGSPEIEVEVPHGATVSVDSASAELEVSDLSGTKSFRTASGDAKISRLAGAVRLETVSGDVDLDGQAPLELTLRSVSGDVRVRVPRLRKLDLSTTSGDIWLDAELHGDGPFEMRSISGDVTIVGRAGFRVEAETITGDMSSDLPSKRESSPGRKVLIVGRPGPTLAFKSVSGDLEIVQPRDAAPPTVPSPPLAPEAPTPPAPPAGPGAKSISSSELDTARLEILRELERGEISVADATDRLGKLDEVLR